MVCQMLISGFLSLIRLSDDFGLLLGGLKMRMEVYVDAAQKNVSKDVVNDKNQIEEAINLLNAVSSIVNRGNNAEIKRKRDGTFTVYEVKKNIVTVR